MNPSLKYALGRLAIFVACAVPAVLLFPRDMDVLLKIMIALVVSAVLSYFALRGLRNEVAQRLSDSARQRIEERQRLRTALAGDEPGERRESTDDGTS